MPNWDDYDSIFRFDGNTRRDRTIAHAKNRISSVSADHPSYFECVIDGERKIRLLIMNSEQLETKKIKVLPEDAQYIHLGSIIEWKDGYWLVTELNADDTVTKGGYMKYCNVKIRFQLYADAAIYERHGVLDSGVYSTTLKETLTMPEINWQYKLYLPYDDKTSMLYVDKRFAVGTMPTKHGQVLECYRFTKRDSIGESSRDGRLLVMYCKSDVYNEKNDNFDELICDYVSPSDSDTGESSLLAGIEYNGNPLLRIGGSGKTFTCLVCDDAGTEITDASISWALSVTDENIVLDTVSSNKCKVTALSGAIDGTLTILRATVTRGETVVAKSVQLEVVEGW